MSNEDRSWMYQRLLSNTTINPKFVDGVDEFLNFVGTNEEYIRCPCIRCAGARYYKRNDIRLHLYRFGFQRDYVVWHQHGEITESLSTDMEADAFMESGSSSHVDPMVDMVFETVGHNEHSPEISNTEAQNLYKLLQEAEQFIWNGCEVTIYCFNLVK
ncbi:hypothetical protein ZOSMA_45G00810, partial [Zostera marina]